jgi:DNA-binding beta-propeller fold protein YncE
VRGGDVAYSAATGRLYASVSGTDAQYPNRVVAIDPLGGTVTASAVVGAEPHLLALSDDESALYVGLDSAHSVRRIAPATLVPGLQFPLTTTSANALMIAGEMAVVPGRTGSIVVSRLLTDGSRRLLGTAVYDDGASRALEGPSITGASTFAFVDSDSVLYGFDIGTTQQLFYRFAVRPDGLTVTETLDAVFSGFHTGLTGASGRLYGSDGVVLDAELRVRVGLLGRNMTAIRVDPSLGRVFGMEAGRIAIYDINTFALLGSVAMPVAVGGPLPDPIYFPTRRIVRCGGDCLAWADGTQVIIARSPAFAP